MKKRFLILIVMILFMGTILSSLSLAQGRDRTMSNQPVRKNDMTQREMMAQKEMMEKSFEYGASMKGMTDRSIIATVDGGVIVFAGDKLMKYDKDLNLAREVEIKGDMKAMKKKRKQMMKDCPMMHKSTMGADEEQR